MWLLFLQGSLLGRIPLHQLCMERTAKIVQFTEIESWRTHTDLIGNTHTPVPLQIIQLRQTIFYLSHADASQNMTLKCVPLITSLNMLHWN